MHARKRKPLKSRRRRFTIPRGPTIRDSTYTGEQTSELRSTWGQWITGQQWTHFITFTFRDIRRCISANRVATSITNRAFRATGQHSRAVIAGEYGGSSGRYHLHGLLHMDARGCERVVDWWRSSYGLTHDRKYDPGRGAGGYVAKYVLKEQGSIAELAIAEDGDGRPPTASKHEQQEKEKEHRKLERLYYEITWGAEKTVEKEEKEKIWQEIRSEKEQLNARYKGVYEWLDERPMSGYDRYLTELNACRQQSNR